MSKSSPRRAPSLSKISGAECCSRRWGYIKRAPCVKLPHSPLAHQHPGDRSCGRNREHTLFCLTCEQPLKPINTSTSIPQACNLVNVPQESRCSRPPANHEESTTPAHLRFPFLHFLFLQRDRSLFMPIATPNVLSVLQESAVIPPTSSQPVDKT